MFVSKSRTHSRRRLRCGSLKLTELKAELINGQPQISLWMKLRTRIRDSKVHEVGYRFFLFTRATVLGCDRFFARNQLEKGDQIVTALIEGDQQQIMEFRKFVETNRPEGSEVSDVAFEDYQGMVMSVDSFLHYFNGDQLSRGKPALLRIDRKQDRILEKLEDTRSDIVGEPRA